MFYKKFNTTYCSLFVEVDETFGVKKITVFASGKINFIGVTNESNAQKTFTMLDKQLQKFKLNPSSKEKTESSEMEKNIEIQNEVNDLKEIKSEKLESIPIIDAEKTEKYIQKETDKTIETKKRKNSSDSTSSNDSSKKIKFEKKPVEQKEIETETVFKDKFQEEMEEKESFTVDVIGK